jgi:hypothetical protein
MHIDFTIPHVSGNVLAGAGLGALFTAGFLTLFILLAWLGVAAISLGAPLSAVLEKKVVVGCLVFIAAGAVVGGLIAATGLPWWAAGTIVLAALIGLHKVTKYFDNRRHARRGY